jgi:phosphocarrier protein
LGAGEELQISVVIAAPTGLHARPAIRLSRLAKQFRASILVRGDDSGEWVDAKSIVRLMALRVAEGGRLQISVRGDDAELAIVELRALVARDFNEAERPGSV